MKKIIGLMLTAVIVLLMAIVSAGCIGDQIEGTYSHTYNDVEELIKFNGDGTYVRASFDFYGNLKNKYQGTWEKTGDNAYTIGNETTITGYGVTRISSTEKVEYNNGYVTRYKYGVTPVNYMKYD